MKSPEDKHKLVVDEFASQIVKRIFKEFLSGKSMYKIAEGLNRDGIDTPGVYIAMQVGSEKQLARYREKKPLWNNVAIGRILGNEQYTGTMIYSRFKNENVGDKHAKALPEEILVPVSKESMKHIVWLAKWSVVIADTACPILMPDDRSIIVQIII